MRKTACPVVWEGAGAQSPSPDPIQLCQIPTLRQIGQLRHYGDGHAGGAGLGADGNAHGDGIRRGDTGRNDGVDLHQAGGAAGGATGVLHYGALAADGDRDPLYWLGRGNSRNFAIDAGGCGLAFTGGVEHNHAAGRGGTSGGIEGVVLVDGSGLPLAGGDSGEQRGRGEREWNRDGRAGCALVLRDHLDGGSGNAVGHDGGDLCGGSVNNGAGDAIEQNARSRQLRAERAAGRLVLGEERGADAGSVDDHDFTGRDGAGQIARAIHHGVDGRRAGAGPEQADGVVGGIGDVETARAVGQQSPRLVQLRQGRGAAIARITTGAAAGDGCDRTGG